VPPGARVTVDAGGPTTTTTPGEVKLERDKSHVAVVEKEGFQTTAVPLKRDVSMNVFGNFACIVLFPICFGIDFLSGNAFELKPDPVTITLVPVEAPPVSAAPPAPLSAAPHRKVRGLKPPRRRSHTDRPAQCANGNSPRASAPLCSGISLGKTATLHVGELGKGRPRRKLPVRLSTPAAGALAEDRRYGLFEPSQMNRSPWQPDSISATKIPKVRSPRRPLATYSARGAYAHPT
jgi:hypothetical protein